MPSITHQHHLKAQPLIGYAASSELWGVQGDVAATRRLADHIRRKLASEGEIRITKNPGMFVARL